jgi:hypothetical protein
VKARVGARCGVGTEGERGIRGDQEDAQLTVSTWSLTASAEVAGITGERWRSAAQAGPDSRGSGLPGGRYLMEENEDVAAELVASSAWCRDERSGGNGERSGARVSACGQRRRGERGGEMGLLLEAATAFIGARGGGKHPGRRL